VLLSCRLWLDLLKLIITVALFALSCSPWTSIITTTNQIVAKLTSTSNQIVASLHDLVEIENPVHMNCKEPILTNTVFISQKKKKNTKWHGFTRLCICSCIFKVRWRVYITKVTLSWDKQGKCLEDHGIKWLIWQVARIYSKQNPIKLNLTAS